MIRTTSLTAVAVLLLSTAAAHGAGYVSASVKKGDLIIKGDDFANVLSIERQGGVVTVYGYSGTLINGYSSVSFIVTDDIKIKLEDGDDSVAMYYLDVDDCSIKTGDGYDYVYFYACSIGDDLKVNLGDDNDTFYMDYTIVHDKTSVKLGDGDDYQAFYSSTFEDNSKVRGSDGDDDIYFSQCTFEDDLDVDGGDDDDEVRLYSNTVLGRDGEFDGGDDYDALYLDIPYDSDDVDIDDFEAVSA